MADEGVPWMIGGGLKHPVEVCRLVSYVGNGGVEGVVLPGDLQVQAMAVPGQMVRIAPGAAAILNRAPGAKADSYAAVWQVEETLAIPPTSSAGGRTDMIVAKIENPYQPNETAYPFPSAADIAAGTAIFRHIRRIPNVPANARTLAEAGFSGYSAIPLARVTLPASTGTVLPQHITELRGISQPKSEHAPDIYAPSGTTTTGLANWTPFPAGPRTLYVPSWATEVTGRVIIGGVGFGAKGNNGGAGYAARGQLRLNVGGITGAASTYDLDTDGGKDRTIFMAGLARTKIPRAMRGTNVEVIPQATRTAGNHSPSVDPNSVVSIDITFSQLPEGN